MTNPLDDGVTTKLKKVDPNIVVLSHKSKLKENGYYLIKSPGEYEVKDVFVYGYQSASGESSDHQSDVYMFDVENIHLGFIDTNVKKMKSGVLDEMGIVNVLFVSISDKSEMKVKDLVELVNKIEPQIVIPMDFTNETLNEFSKIMGVPEKEKMPNITIKKADFTDEEAPLRIVVLEK